MKNSNIPESHRIRIEKKTIDKMIRIFCRFKHNTSDNLCEECQELHDYAFQRLINCPYQEEKPVCTECPIHCYKREMKERVKNVMRYAGPKMIFFHPYLAFMHLINEKFHRFALEEQ